MQTIAERLKSAHLRMEQATANAHRPLNSVELLAVSKTKPVSQITQAYEAGQRKFGENYVQEGVEKIQYLRHLDDIEWHLIGPLQSNKTKIVAEHFHWVQSVDRLKIARRLNEQRPSDMPPLNICIQINIDDEQTKSGLAPADVPAFIDDLTALQNLRLRGLMAIPKARPNKEEQIHSLQQLEELFTRYHTNLSDFDTLSVGMSDDLEQAIECGSTMVRIGTAIFGSRN